MSDRVAPITVIIPCLNAEATLGDALDSVFTQTVRPLEVLVIDDHSADRSAAVARSYHPSVRVLTNPGTGMGVARGLGVREAQGEFIAFVDADDLLHPSKHEKQLAVLDTHDRHTLCHTGAMLAWPDGSQSPRPRRSGTEATGRCTRVIFERNPVCGATTMIRRDVVLDLGNYDPDLRRAQDFGLSLAASSCCDFVYLDEPLYVEHRHERNVTRHKATMAYYHWLAQERFRQRFPDLFSQIPGESVHRYMIEPVLHAVRDAYWRRDGDDYRRLLQLAQRLAPDDPDIRHCWRRRRVPMSVLRLRDRLTAARHEPATETS